MTYTPAGVLLLRSILYHHPCDDVHSYPLSHQTLNRPASTSWHARLFACPLNMMIDVISLGFSAQFATTERWLRTIDMLLVFAQSRRRNCLSSASVSAALLTFIPSMLPRYPRTDYEPATRLAAFFQSSRRYCRVSPDSPDGARSHFLSGSIAVNDEMRLVVPMFLV